jgi:hypothetical protein
MRPSATTAAETTQMGRRSPPVAAMSAVEASAPTTPLRYSGSNARLSTGDRMSRGRPEARSVNSMELAVA